MKQIISLFSIVTFAISALFAQSEEELVTTIRERFATANQNISAYEKQERELSGESTEGGMLRTFSVDGTLVVMQAEFYGETGNKKEHFYYLNGDLYFAFFVEEFYDRPISVEGSQVETKTENRFYFHKDEMIRWLDTKKVKRDKKSFDFRDAERMVIDESQRLLHLMSNND